MYSDPTRTAADLHEPLIRRRQWDRQPGTAEVSAVGQYSTARRHESRTCACCKFREIPFLGVVEVIASTIVDATIERLRSVNPQNLFGRLPLQNEIKVCIWLRTSMTIPTKHENIEHRKLLERLWIASFPNKKYSGVSEHWPDIGFQGRDPFTDTRGGGTLALRAIVYLFERRGDLVRRIKGEQARRVQKVRARGVREGDPAFFPNYPIACCMIHVVRLVCRLFGVSGAPGKEMAFAKESKNYWGLLLKEGTPNSFFALCIVCLDLFDQTYIGTEDSNYMQFNSIFGLASKKFETLLKSNYKKSSVLKKLLHNHAAVAPNTYGTTSATTVQSENLSSVSRKIELIDVDKLMQESPATSSSTTVNNDLLGLFDSKESNKSVCTEGSEIVSESNPTGDDFFKAYGL